AAPGARPAAPPPRRTGRGMPTASAAASAVSSPPPPALGVEPVEALRVRPQPHPVAGPDRGTRSGPDDQRRTVVAPGPQERLAAEVLHHLHRRLHRPVLVQREVLRAHPD